MSLSLPVPGWQYCVPGGGGGSVRPNEPLTWGLLVRV